MRDVYLVAAVRTPIGKRGGGLSDAHPVDLGAHVLRELTNRTGIETVDEVIFGCVDQIGAQSYNLARGCVLAAGWPEEVGGVTVDRQCGSSLQALRFATAGVKSGMQDLVVAGGVEVMSSVPISSSTYVGVENGLGDPTAAEGLRARYGETEMSQFHGASLMSQRFDLSRAELDAFALESHRRAITAWEEGRFDEEVAPVGGVERDEGPRPDTSAEKLAALPTLPGYPELTAGIASQISDGASAVMVASSEAIERHRLTPLARIVDMVGIGSDPIEMLSGPIPATDLILERNGLALSDIDLFEVNEAFASVVLGWAKATGAPLEKTNINGGAIALGHPLGATGTKIVANLTYTLRDRKLERGLLAICEGGGTANAVLIEPV